MGNFISNSPMTTNIVTNADGTVTITVSQSTTYDSLFIVLVAVVVIGIATFLWMIFARKNDSDSN